MVQCTINSNRLLHRKNGSSRPDTGEIDLNQELSIETIPKCHIRVDCPRRPFGSAPATLK